MRALNAPIVGPISHFGSTVLVSSIVNYQRVKEAIVTTQSTSKDERCTSATGEEEEEM